MNFLHEMKQHISSEYETLEFLKVEVVDQAKEIKRLEAKVLMAYSFGFEDCYKGLKFDKNFSIDNIEIDDKRIK